MLYYRIFNIKIIIITRHTKTLASINGKKYTNISLIPKCEIRNVAMYDIFLI